MTDIAALGFSIDSGPAATASQQLEKLTAAARKAENAAIGVGNSNKDAADSLRRIAAAVAALDGPLGGVASRFRSVGTLIDETSVAAVAISATLGAAILAARRFLVEFADSWSDLSARIGLAIGNMDASGVVLDRLASVARRTYSALETTAESFLRNATTLRELGKSTAEQLDYTEALNNALVVSGAKAERATQVQEALGRAMALGVLRGQELNTVIQTGGRVAEVIAEELGVGVNQLRRLGEQGKITGDVIYSALTSRMVQLREEAERMPATIGDAFTILRNSALQAVGVYDQTQKLSESVAIAIIGIADSLDIVVKALGVLIGVLAGRFGAALVEAGAASARYYLAVASGSAVIIGSAEAERMKALAMVESTRVARNAAMAQVAGAQATVVQLQQTLALATAEQAAAVSTGAKDQATRAMVRTQTALRGAEAALTTAKAEATVAANAASAAMARVNVANLAAGPAARVATAALGGLSTALAFLGGPVGLLILVATALYTFRDSTVEIGGATVRVGNVVSAVWVTVRESIAAVIVAVGGLAETIWQFVTLDWNGAMTTAGETAADLVRRAEDVKRAWRDVDVGWQASVTPALPEGGAAASPGGNVSDYERAIKSVREHVDALRLDAATFGMTEVAAARYRVETELLNAAQQAGMALTPELVANHRALAEAMGLVTAQLERQKLEKELMTPDEVFAEQIATLRDLYGEDAENFRAYQAAKARYELDRLDAVRSASQTEVDMRRKTVEMSVDLLQRFGQQSKAAAIAAILLNKALAAATIIQDTARASMAAAAANAVFGPAAAAAAASSMWALGATQLAIVAATGGLEIAALGKNSASTSVSTSSSGVGGGSSNASDIASTPIASSTPQQGKTIVLKGSYFRFEREELRELMREWKIVVLDGVGSE